MLLTCLVTIAGAVFVFEKLRHRVGTQRPKRRPISYAFAEVQSLESRQQPSATFGNHVYDFIAEPVSQAEATSRAQQAGGELATIDSAAENNFIASLTGGRMAWINATDMATEGLFRTSSGITLAYTNWAAGEPNNYGGNEDYAAIGWLSANAWNDLDGSKDIAVVFNVGFVIERATPQVLDVNLSSSRVREGGVITATVHAPSGNTRLYCDLLKDGVLSQSLPDKELGSDGSATVSYSIQTNILANGAAEDRFDLRLRASGLETTVPIVITRFRLAVNLSQTRIREGTDFQIAAAAPIGSTAFYCGLYHDGVLVKDLPDREVGPDGTLRTTYRLPTNILARGATEDGFELKFRAAGVETSARFTVVKSGGDPNVSPPMPQPPASPPSPKPAPTPTPPAPTPNPSPSPQPTPPPSTSLPPATGLTNPFLNEFIRAAQKVGVPTSWASNSGLINLVSHESSWRVGAKNPTSTAFGLFQFLKSTWKSYLPEVSYGTQDPFWQAVGGFRYIKARYGTPDAAWTFWQSHRWY